MAHAAPKIGRPQLNWPQPEFLKGALHESCVVWLANTGVGTGPMLAAMGCASAHPRVITDAQAQAVRDTVIALEHATDAAVGHLDCVAAFDRIGDQRPIFVSGGRVVRTRDAFRSACRTPSSRRERGPSS